MKSILRAALLGALIQGGLVFLAVLILCLAEGPVFHAPPALMIAGVYGAGGAVLGLVVGAVIGAMFARPKATDRGCVSLPCLAEGTGPPPGAGPLSASRPPRS